MYIKVGLANFTVNGDEAASFLQAQEIVAGARPLLFWGQPYQFPIEPYLMSFFGSSLSWDTFGVRLVPIVICLFSFFIFILLFKKLGSFKETWPGLMLLFFPSTYSLFRQTILFTPQHSITLFFAAACPLLAWYVRNSKYKKTFCIFSGIFAGLALSNHLLAISIVFASGLAICLSVNFKSALKNSFFYSLGLIAGLLPYLYVKLFVEDAYSKVSDSYPISKALPRIWDPIFTEYMTTSLGVNTIYYPDVGRKVDTFVWFLTPFSYILAAIFLFLIADRFIKFLARLKNNKWPSLEIIDILLGTTIAALLLLSLTKMILRPRYALFVVWCFPFLMFYFYHISRGVLKKLVASFLIFLAVINCTNSKLVYAFWDRENVSETHAFMPSLNPLYEYFRENNITHCYSGWWLAYQVNLNSKEEFICSTPFNDRFYGWKQPYYKKLVDLEHNTPIIVGTYQHRWIELANIVKFYNNQRLELDIKKIGKFTLLENPRHMDVAESYILKKGVSVSESSLGAGEAALLDNNLSSSWHSQENQKKGQFIELKLEKPTKIHGLRIFSNVENALKKFPLLKIFVYNSKDKELLLKNDKYGTSYPIKLEKDYPRFAHEGTQLFYGFSPTEAARVKIEVGIPKKDFKWKVSEIQLYVEEK